MLQSYCEKLRSMSHESHHGCMSHESHHGSMSHQVSSSQWLLSPVVCCLYQCMLSAPGSVLSMLHWTLLQYCIEWISTAVYITLLYWCLLYSNTVYYITLYFALQCSPPPQCSVSECLQCSVPTTQYEILTMFPSPGVYAALAPQSSGFSVPCRLGYSLYSSKVSLEFPPCHRFILVWHYLVKSTCNFDDCNYKTIDT